MNVSITTDDTGKVTLTFTRPDDTGTDRSTSVIFEAVEWAKFVGMVTAATASASEVQ